MDEVVAFRAYARTKSDALGNHAPRSKSFVKDAADEARILHALSLIVLEAVQSRTFAAIQGIPLRTESSLTLEFRRSKSPYPSLGCGIDQINLGGTADDRDDSTQASELENQVLSVGNRIVDNNDLKPSGGKMWFRL